MHTQLVAKCPNQLCQRAGGIVACPEFCSQQCAYLYTLSIFRRSTTVRFRRERRRDASPLQRAQSRRPDKCHTFMLIRCGIDPWAPAAEIQMRQLSGQALILQLGRYSQSANVADYAWPLENMCYCLSHLPEHAGSWAAAPATSAAASCSQRYHLLCSALVRQIECNVPYVCALLGGCVHPSEFYVGVFGR